MKLLATAAPTETAKPTRPPPTAAETPTTVAMIEDWFSASRATFPVPGPLPAPGGRILLFGREGWFFVGMTLVDPAPAPLMPIGARGKPPTATATEAATESAVIELSRAHNEVSE